MNTRTYNNNIYSYGIELKQLTHDKIELIRFWRNDPKINRYMEFRDEITTEMQEKWFERISNSGTDFYYIIVADGNEIGCINLKDVDFENKTGETGIFIWDDNYLNGTYGIRAALCIHDYAFENLKLDYIHGHALDDNKRANRLNDFLGYKVLSNQENIYNKEIVLLKNDYYKKTAGIKKLLNDIYTK